MKTVNFITSMAIGCVATIFAHYTLTALGAAHHLVLIADTLVAFSVSLVVSYKLARRLSSKKK